MVRGAALLAAFKQAVNQPFRVVPYFDPGPWGGQWLKKVIGLDPNQVNFAWGFDCVPEENSLLLQFGDMIFRNALASTSVFNQPEQLLGKKVHEAFGAGVPHPLRFPRYHGRRQPQPAGASAERIYPRKIRHALIHRMRVIIFSKPKKALSYTWD